MKVHDVNVMGVVGRDTNERERLEVENDEYVMIGKGRSKQMRKGGGIGIMLRKNRGIEMEEIESGKNVMDEDIMIVKLEFKDRKKCLIVIVCYMTVEGENARVENEIKYNSLKRLIGKFDDEEVLIMGDMNGHIGILSERVNANGERLLKFMDEADVENLNVTMADGKVTWRARENESAIDFVLANEGARRNIRKMVIDEDGRMGCKYRSQCFMGGVLLWKECRKGKSGKWKKEV